MNVTVFEGTKNSVVSGLEGMLKELTAELQPDEYFRESAETEFGTLEFRVQLGNNDKPSLRVWLPSSEQFIINGVAYHNLSAEVEMNWQDQIWVRVSFSRVDAWDGKKYNDQPTDTARSKVRSTIETLATSMWTRLSSKYEQYKYNNQIINLKRELENALSTVNSISQQITGG